MSDRAPVLVRLGLLRRLSGRWAASEQQPAMSTAVFDQSAVWSDIEP